MPYEFCQVEVLQEAEGQHTANLMLILRIAQRRQPRLHVALVPVLDSSSQLSGHAVHGYDVGGERKMVLARIVVRVLKVKEGVKFRHP